MYYTYVLEISKKNTITIYVGSTSNLKNRLDNHKDNSVKTTKKHQFVKLIYYEACLNKTDALKRENQLKTGFGRGYIKRRLKTYFVNKRD